MSINARIEKPLYTAHASSLGGRSGTFRTDDGTLDLKIAMPPGLGGQGGGSNPEQLFAAGYAACIGSAVQFVAGQKKVATGPVRIDAAVTIGTMASDGFGLALELTAFLPALARSEAEALVVAAHQVCPYSNATRGNIQVDVKVG
jgi:osmotically inducible protein OsmC